MKRLWGKFTESIDRVEKDNIVIGSTQRDEGDLVTCSSSSSSSSSSSDRVDSRGPLRQPGVATTTSLRPFSTNAEGCTIADLLDP